METINLEVQNECEKKEIGKQEQKNAQQFQNYSVKSLISIDDFKHKSMVSSTVKQVWAAILPLFGMYICGMSMGYSAVLLPQLEANDTRIEVTEEISSWIASMTALSMIPGSLLGIFCMEKFGRKNCLLYHCVPSVCGWITIYLSNNVTMMLVGRFLAGISVGICGPPAPILIGETSKPKLRGMFLAGISSALTTGILTIHVLGTFLTWETSALVCSVFPVVLFLMLLTIPETPPWLMGKNRVEDAEKSLKWLRGEKYLKEFEDMKRDHENPDIQRLGIWESVQKREFLIAVFIVFGFFFTMQISGVYVITFYTVSIMEGIFEGTINEYLSMIVVDSVRVLMSFAGCIMARKIRRKTLTLVTGIGTAISIFMFSGYSFLMKAKPEVFDGYSWVSLIFLVLYMCFVHSGVYVLPFILKGEYFSLATRGVGSGATSLFNFFGMFVVVKLAPTMFHYISLEGTFIFYGVSVLIGNIILYFVMVETKNKTLAEIEEEFKKK